MSVVEVERCIWDLHRRGGKESFFQDPEAFLASYKFSPEERTALLAKDYAALYAMGIHPMATLFYSQVNKTPMPVYLQAIGSTAERVSQLAKLKM